MKFYISRNFRKSVKKIQAALQAAKYNSTLHKDVSSLISEWIRLRMRKASHESCREVSTHILCPITPPPENQAFYEIMWRILCFVDRASLYKTYVGKYNSAYVKRLTNNPTKCTIRFNIFIYFSSLHVSGIHVPIIRGKLLYLCDTGICHSVWVW